MNSLMFGSFLHDDFVENSLDMGLGSYVRFSLWVVAVIGKLVVVVVGGWVKALVKVSGLRCHELVVGWRCI